MSDEQNVDVTTLDDINVELVSIDSFKADPFQARDHDERNIEMIAESIRRVGTARSTVIDEDNTLLAGHGATAGAKRAGIKQALIIEVPPDTMLVRRVRGLSGQQKLFLAVADNRTTDTSKFNPEALQRAALAGLPWEPLFTPDEFAPILNADWTPSSEEPLPTHERDTTNVHLSAEQYALVKQVQSIVDEELEGSEEVDEAKAIEYACKLFLTTRRQQRSKDITPPSDSPSPASDRSNDVH